MKKRVLIISLTLLVIVTTLRLTVHFVPPTTTQVETEVVHKECQVTVYSYVYEQVMYMGDRSIGELNIPEEEKCITIPHSFDGQIITSVRCNRQIIGEGLDEDGNKVFFLDYPSVLRPGESLKLKIEIDYVLFGPRQLEIPKVEDVASVKDIPTDLAPLTQAEGPWEAAMRDPQIITLAEKLADPNPFQSILNILEWIDGHVKYDWEGLLTGSVRIRYPEEVFYERKGDCDEVANLIIALCRLQDIPAYLERGRVYIHEESLFSTYTFYGLGGRIEYQMKNVAGHAWVKAYVPLKDGGGVWLPIDWTAMLRDPIEAIEEAGTLGEEFFLITGWTKHTDYVGEWRDFCHLLQTYDLTIKAEASLTRKDTISVSQLTQVQITKTVIVSPIAVLHTPLARHLLLAIFVASVTLLHLMLVRTVLRKITKLPDEWAWLFACTQLPLAPSLWFILLWIGW